MKLLVLPGDGIGSEITAVALQCLERLRDFFSLDLTWDVETVGLSRLAERGSTMPEDLVERARDYDGVILGPLSTSDYPSRAEGGYNASAELRKQLDLYANIRPCRGRPGISRNPDMDLIIVRENSEGFFADRNMTAGSGELMPTPDLALAIRKITSKGSRRIARVACELAMGRRSHVAVVHKVNSLKLSDGLFLRETRQVAASFQGIALREVLVDAMAALLIRQPSQFDIILATNLFGDILSDEAGELSGSLGLASSLNVGDRYAVAQAVHGSAPDIAGKGVANPTGLLLSIVLLLEWLAKRESDDPLKRAAESLAQAVESALADPLCRTRDLGGQAGTAAFGGAVTDLISSPNSQRTHKILTAEVNRD